VVRRGVSLRKTRVCYGSTVSSRCPRSVMIFCGVFASVELLKNGGRLTTPSKVPVPSHHKSLLLRLFSAQRTHRVDSCRSEGRHETRSHGPDKQQAGHHRVGYWIDYWYTIEKA
jgi:hypothetical protein